MIFIDGFPIDVAISEDHTFNSVVTSNAVERGANINDHVRKESNMLAYEGLVSNAPTGRVRALRGGDSNPALTAYDRLQLIRDRGEAVVIEDSLGVYVDYLLTGLSVPRSKENPDTALRFKVTFTEARFVTSERTFVRVATTGAGAKRNLGSKPTDKDKKPGDTKAERKKSWLLQGGKNTVGGNGLGLTDFFD